MNPVFNLPNRLTIGRLFLTILFVICLSWEQIPFHQTAALVLFCIAGFTDYIDGVLARKLGLITNFGKLMDPLIDKIMVTAAFICLIPLGAVPAWAAIIIVAREFLVTGLRLLAGSKNQVLAAESLGKQKTIWQIVTAIFYLALLSGRELGLISPQAAAWGWLWDGLGSLLLLLAVGFTLVSGLNYFWKHRDLVLRE